MQHWSNMYLISASYMQLFFYPFLLQKEPCLRWWKHSSMSLFWNAIVLTGDQAQSSCKFRYQVAKNARPCFLRDSRQSNLIYPAWLRVAKNARCCVQRCVVEVEQPLCSWTTVLPEMLQFIWLNLNSDQDSLMYW